MRRIILSLTIFTFVFSFNIVDSFDVVENSIVIKFSDNFAPKLGSEAPIELKQLRSMSELISNLTILEFRTLFLNTNNFNESEYKDYAKHAAKAVKEFDGEFLVTGKGVQNQMESGSLPKTVVVKFKTYEDALSCYQCEAYEKALDFIENSSDRDFVILEGLD